MQNIIQKYLKTRWKMNLSEMLAIVVFSLHIFFSYVSCLECYVCDHQDSNEGKCTKTIKTCEYGEDRCLSIIKWGSTPYYSEGAKKQYYVSKMCATEELCEKQIKGSMSICHYIWYEDWECAECCQGNRCNYYVTLGSSSLSGSVSILILSLSSVLFGRLFL